MTGVDVWVDVVCPWCYLGKRRLERALDVVGGGDEIDVRWRAFQLDPDAPRGNQPGAGEPVVAYLARKYGVTVDDARRMQERVTELAAAEGLTYRLDRALYASSFDAQRLVAAARERGLAGTVLERLFAAHHSEGRRIDDHETLIELAADAGMESEEARRVLASDVHAEAVERDRREAAELGVGGVPFFLIDGRYAVSGAQPVELLAQALRRAAADVA